MKQRLVTGIVAGTGFIGVTIIGGPYYIGLMVLLAIIGYYEFARMNGFRANHPSTLIGYAGLMLLVLPWSEFGVAIPSDKAILWILAFLLLAVTVITSNRTAIDGAALMLLGAVYIGYGFQAMIQVRGIEENGLLWVFLLFGCIWGSDIGAYFTGRAVGKRKLWPSISPNKTVEGAIGGVALSLVVAVVFALAAPELLTLGKALLIGLAAAVAGQFGDLIQSAYKRFRNIKDSGKLLPGHGGVLDRCDSWLIVFPLLVFSGLIPV